jgi:hypothetical protein
MRPRAFTARVRASLIAVISGTTITAAEAQDRRLLVADSAGTPIPFAMVTLPGGTRRVGTDSGYASVGKVALGDSIKLVVRRVGYAPFEGWVRAVADPLVVRLSPLARALAAVTVSERANTPLARTGFYDRLERSRRGTAGGRFITPEELDLRNPSHISQMLGGESQVKLVRQMGKVLLTGRGHGCAMTVLIDGMRLSGMVEEVYTQEGIAEHRNDPRAIEQFLLARQTVDDVVSALSVAAIEIYPRASSAPVEIQRHAGAEACGIVAIWTGSRQ